MVFLECDGVVEQRSFKRAEDALGFSGYYDPVKVPDQDSADNRMQAIWITTDILGYCNYDWDSGPLRLIHMIKERRTEAVDPFSFTIRVDASFRGEIYKKMYLEGEKFRNLPYTINWILDHKAEILIERALNAGIRQEASVMMQVAMHDIDAISKMHYRPITPRQGPRDAADEPESPPKIESEAERSRKERRKAAKKAKRGKDAIILKEAKAWKKPGRDGKGGGKGGGKADARASGKIPQKEYDRLIKLPQAMPGQPQKRKCLFWNSTKGCDKGNDCRFVHRCMACNQDHRWCKRHM